MQNWISNHVRSNVVGYISLFVALSGTAYAIDGPLAGQNTVGSADIIDAEVTNNDLDADSVGSAKIVDRSVKNADLSLGASSSNTIADGGIQGIDVKNDALTGTQIDEPSLDPTILQRRISASCGAGSAVTSVTQVGGVSCNSFPASLPPFQDVGLQNATGGCFLIDDQWADQSPDVNNEVSFTRDPLGLVHLRGIATKCGAPGSGNTIFALPAGSRPAHLEHLGTVAANDFGAVEVDPSNGNVTAVAGNFDRSTGGWISLDGLLFRCGPSGVDGCP